MGGRGGSREGPEEWSNTEASSKAKLAGISGAVDVRCEKKRR